MNLISQGLNLNAARENNQLTFIDGMSLFLECLEDQDPSGETNQPIDLKRYPQNLQRRISCLPGFVLIIM